MRLARFEAGLHPKHSTQLRLGAAFRPSRTAVGWLLATKKRPSRDGSVWVELAGGEVGSSSDFGSAAHRRGILKTVGIPDHAFKLEVAAAQAAGSAKRRRQL